MNSVEIMMLIVLVMALAMVIGVAVIRRDCVLRYMSNASSKGGGRTARPRELFHGSTAPIDVLEPRPSHVLDGEDAVFATSSYLDAVIFAPGWTDYNFAFGIHDGQPYLAEQYPDAFDKLRKTCYIHRVAAKGFARDRRTGLPNEYISRDTVTPFTVDTVDAYDYVMKAAAAGLIDLHKYAPVRPVDVPKSLARKISRVIVFIDIHDGRKDRHICANNVTIVNLTGDDAADIRNIRAARGLVELVGDPVDLGRGILRFANIPRVLVAPGAFHGNAKTTQVEFDKFVACRYERLRA